MLAYGYEESGDRVEIYVYESTHLFGDQKCIEFTHDDLSNRFAPNYVGDDDLFAFFAVGYPPKDTPVI